MLAYTDVRLLQPLNASLPIVCKPSGKDTELRLLQYENAPSPIDCKPLGKDTELRLV